MAKRKKAKDLTRQEDFINEEIIVAIEHTPNFDVGLISNGEYSFSDIEEYLKMFKAYDHFKKYLKMMSNTEFDKLQGVTFDKIYIDEVSKDDLPFAEKEYIKNE